ncbi:hypothetical protein B0H14DRAFT_739418 [Mycena olivaceomarginata]|nr:hypothetical protein B0H14DRAFT_739418 [Mycena olivaceomarginata]
MYTYKLALLVLAATAAHAYPVASKNLKSLALVAARRIPRIIEDDPRAERRQIHNADYQANSPRQARVTAPLKTNHLFPLRNQRPLNLFPRTSGRSTTRTIKRMVHRLARTTAPLKTNRLLLPLRMRRPLNLLPKTSGGLSSEFAPA